MATLTTWLNGSTTAGIHPAHRRSPYLVEVVVSAADQSIATGDVVQCINVPAETIVLFAGVEVLTVSNKVCTADLGTSDDDDEWCNDVDMAATGHKTILTSGTTAYVPTMETSAETIDLTFTVTSGPMTVGIFRVYALMVDISGVRETSAVA